MILLLYGDDTFRSRRRLRKLRDAFREKHDPSGINIVELDGSKLTVEGLLSHLAVQGFLASKRLFIITNLITDGPAAVQEEATTLLKERKGESENILLFWEAGDVKTTARKEGKRLGKQALALWQALQSVAKKEAFPTLSAAQIVHWIDQEARDRGATIEPRAAQRLGTAVGTDLWRVDTELEKLIHYAHGRTVTEEDVHLLVAAAIDDDIFRLTDALGQRKIELALNVLEDQFMSGAEPLYLLRMLTWHLRNLIGVRSLLDAGTLNSRTIAKELGIHPFVAQKTTKQAELFTLDQLRAAYHDLLIIETTIKTRQVDPRTLFDLLVVAFRRPSAAVRPVRA